MAKGGSLAAYVRLCLAALVVTVVTWPALAVDCENVKPGEVMACLARNLREADGLIDKTYQAARARLDDQGKAKLLAEQRAWIEKRNRTCGVTSGQGDREAWLRDILKDEYKTICVGGMTRGRIDELNRYGVPSAPAVPDKPTAPETAKVEPPAHPVAQVQAPPATEPAPPPSAEKPAPAPSPPPASPAAATPAHEEGESGGLLRLLGLGAAFLAVVFLLYRYGRSGVRALAPLVKRAAATASNLAMDHAPAVRPATSNRASISPAPGGSRRFLWFKIIACTIWGLFVLFLLWQSVNDIRQMIDLSGTPDVSSQVDPRALRSNPFYQMQMEAMRAQGSVARQQPLDNLALNLWGLLGAAALAYVGINPKRWIGMRRFILGGVALALCLGRPAQGLLSYYALSLIERGSVWDFVIWLIVDPLLMLMGGFMVIGAICAAIAAAFGLFIAIPVAAFNQIFEFERALTVYRYQRTGLTNYITRFIYWLAGEPLPAPPPDESRGARFATGEEIAALQDPKGMAFGHVGGSPLLVHTEKHVLIMGGTRSGKGVSLIVPHLLRYRGSAFVLDPKGENAKATGRHRASINDAVHTLDPFGITGRPRSRFNPLARFTPENMEAESKALAAALVLMHDTRDHWTASAQQLLAALILHVVTSKNIPPESKDLPTVRRLLLNDIHAVLAEMETSTAADGLVGALANSFLKTPEKEFGSIVSTAQRETEILDNPFIIACLSASGPGEDVDFKAWRTGTMTVYLCLSAPKFPVFNRWLRLVLTSALDEMTDMLAPPPLPVCFMLDELATLGHLQPVENAVGLAAGYGIQLVTVFQDVAQMRDLYKGRWASFIGNAGVRALFALDDYDTASYWSNFMGGHVVETVSRQVDIYGMSGGRNVGETFRPLLTPEQIMMRYAAGPNGTGTMLVLPEGSHPVESDKVPYFADSDLKGIWDDPRAATESSLLHNV